MLYEVCPQVCEVVPPFEPKTAGEHLLRPGLMLGLSSAPPQANAGEGGPSPTGDTDVRVADGVGRVTATGNAADNADGGRLTGSSDFLLWELA